MEMLERSSPSPGETAPSTPATFAPPHISFTDYRARYVLILCSSFSLCVFECALTLFRSCVVRSLKDIADALDEGLITEEEAAAAKEQESKAYFR